ncbi:MAG: WD40 repeat domain-containing protein, partial [Actinomycetota bacterium]|nr:WD40 repeat domain-containing protein [Actinomycetota bacterium]
GYQPAPLPLLAHALRATWERREGETMTVGAYRRTGGIRRAVAETAEHIYAGLDEPGRAALRAALLSLVTIVDDVPVRRRSSLLETELTVLRPMIEARLVTTGHETVEISHEALLTGWPRLASWLVEAREEILLRQRLGQAAAEWAASGEDADALYRGARLATAREWAAGRDDLPGVQRRFLAASEAAAHAHEMAQRRTNRRLRRLVAGLAVALLLVVTGAVVVWRQQVQAERERREATSRQLAAEARTDFWTDPDRSARRSLAAWQSARTREARTALLQAQHTAVVGRLGSESGAFRVAVSADGRLVAVGFPDGRVQLWDSTSQQRVGPDLRHPALRRGGTGPNADQPARLMSLSFSPDGRFLAGGSVALEKGVAVWEVPSGTLHRILPGFGAVAWLPDATAVLAGRPNVSPAGQIGVWDPADGRVLASIRTGVLGPLDLAVSHDGSLLAVAGDDPGEIIRRADGRRLAELGSKAQSVGFAADNTLFSAGVDGPVQAWPPSTGWRPVTLNDVGTGATSDRLAVSHDGTAFIGGDRPREVLALTLGGPRLPVTGFPSVPSDLALSGDGRLLVLVSQTAPPHLIRLGDQQLPHPQLVGHLAFDPAGQRLATGSNDPAIRIWDPRTGSLRDTITVPGDTGPLGLAYAPDGSLAAAFPDGRIHVFDAAHRPRRTLTVPPELYPADLAFSPDGSLLTVVTTYRDPDNQSTLKTQERDDPDVTVWDARTLQPRAPLKLPGHESIAQAFTPDGRYLLVGSNRSPERGLQDAAIWRFSLPDLSLVDRRDMPGSSVVELAVNPDSTLVSLAQDRRAAPVRE